MPAAVVAIAVWAASISSVVLAAEDRSQVSEFFRQYQDNWTKAQRAYEAANYQEAAKFYANVAELLQYEPASYFYLACCLSRMGEKDASLMALAHAVEFGWEDSQTIATNDDLATIRDDARVNQILQDADACRSETLIIYAGKGVDPKKSAPLVIVLQGLGGAARGELPHWKSAADTLGLVLAVPRAPNRVAPLAYGWHRPGSHKTADLDLEACERTIADAIELAAKRYTIDRKKLVLAGFSQGGYVALRMLHDHPDRFLGAVTVCAVYVSPDPDYWKDLNSPQSIRAYLFAGALDPLCPMSRNARDEMQSAKLNVRYEEVDKSGHEPPQDYAARQMRALRFLLTNSEQ